MSQTAGNEAFTCLRELEMLQDVSDGDLVRIAGVARTLAVSKGRIIYWNDEQPSRVFFIRSGRVALSRFSRTGRRLDLSILGPGDFFGLGALLSDCSNGSQAEAADECVLLALDVLGARRLIERGPHVARRMLPALARQLRWAEEQLSEIAYGSVTARVAALLLRLDDGQEVVAGFSHEELAKSVAADRVSVTRALKQLEAQGCVRNGRRRIHVLDRGCLTEATQAG